MYCKCGGLCGESNYEVSTEKKAVEWLGFVPELPISVMSKTCRACGRVFVKIEDANGNVLRHG